MEMCGINIVAEDNNGQALLSGKRWRPLENKKGRGETAPTFLSLVVFCQYIRGQCASYLGSIMRVPGFGSEG